MRRTNTPQEDAEALNRRLNQPEDEPRARRTGDATAATRLDISKARPAADLAGEARRKSSGETADAIKRAAENERRV